MGDFEQALRGLLGDGAPLSPASLLWLKAQWQQEYIAWKQRRLDELEVVYLWAEGLYVKAGLEDTKAALLVMIGALTNGQKSRPTAKFCDQCGLVLEAAGKLPTAKSRKRIVPRSKRATCRYLLHSTS